MTAIYRFGRIELNPATRQLLVDNQPALLGARALDVLLALIERRDRLVSKNELLDIVWPGVVVEENNIQVQISALRKLLGADAIATVAGRGYRFTLEATPAVTSSAIPSSHPKHNLPAQTTRFIGRENAIRAVKGALSNANVRLLTLSGVGGTGKTRLALQVTADLVDEFEHGVYFIPLAALSNPALVLQAIAQGLAVSEAAGKPLQEQLQGYLRDRHMLLVLDNFEQVIDAASQVGELLTAAPRLKILVTSREVLRLSGETEYPVPPLSLPDPKRLPPLDRFAQYDAVALFIERALAVKFAFTVTNENATAIAEICHQLDGLPLAIELAAAHTRALPPQRILAEFSHRLGFLTGGARDLPERQKTLRNTIDWSYALLTADEQQLFRRLAVFVGGCDLEAIESVCNMKSKLCGLETVESLVGKSLVTQTEADGVPRFAMLETIREYARDSLIAAGDDECMRTRHRDYFLALAEEAEPNLMGAEQAAWLERLEANHENLRAALDWSLVKMESTAGLRLCGAVQRFWLTRGHIAEGGEWCQRVLDMPTTDARPAERAKVLNGAGRLAIHQGDSTSAQALCEKSLAIMREQRDRRGIAASLNNLGGVARYKGDYPAATMLYEESLLICRELGDQHGMASSLGSLGTVALDLGDYPTASARHEECLAIMRNLGDASGIATSLGNLGLLSYEQGDYPSARARQEESLAIRRELGDRNHIAFSLGNLGNVAFMQGAFATSLALIQECLAMWHEVRNIGGVATCLAGLARLVDAVGRPLHAARIWGTAERLREEIGSAQPPVIRARYDLRVAASRAALGDEAAFDQAWLEGRAMTLEQAITLALNETVERLN